MLLRRLCHTPFDRLLGGIATVRKHCSRCKQESKKMSLSKTEMMEAYNAKRPKISFKQGDSVLVYWPAAHKMLRKWHGPYVLDKPLSDSKRVWSMHHLAYPLDRITVHVDRLRKILLGQDEVFVGSTTNGRARLWQTRSHVQRWK